MKKIVKELIFPVFFAAFFVGLVLFDDSEHFKWYQYVGGFLGWIGILGLVKIILFGIDFRKA